MKAAENYTSLERAIIIIAVLMTTLIQVLDTSIVNVSLPYIQGSLAANHEQITWTLTSYLIASVIIMPLTGFMVSNLGRKRYLMICISGFIVTSCLCGLSTNLTELVAFRFAQGLFGAGLIPLSQGIITSIYPASQRGKAMAIWSAGVLAGPVLGPVVGGVITSFASWRWSFYINVPIGLISLLLVYSRVEETSLNHKSIDWLSLGLFATAMSAFAYFLDRGNQQDSFSAVDIKISILIAIIGFALFFFRSFSKHIKPIFNLRIFADRNFTLSTLVLALTGISMYGTMILQPILLSDLLHYPVLTTGLAMAPRGIAAMISMMIVGKIAGKHSPKVLILIGVALSSIGVYLSSTYNLSVDMSHIIYPQLLQGAGMGFIMVPLTTTAFTTIDPKLRMEAFGLYNLIKTLGFSLGITITVLVFAHMNQVNWNHLSGFINIYNHNLSQYLSQIHFSLHDARSYAFLQNKIAEQSSMLSINNSYQFICLSLLAIIPLILLLKGKKPQVL